MTSAARWMDLPLPPDGRTLVEASAGTGKTWTIAALYLRLLLERQLSPRKIIVATFTKAAAAELAERLRARIGWALKEAGHPLDASAIASAPEDVRWLHQRWLDNGDTHKSDVQRLQFALSEFDAAPISTLHALCSRILAEHPFAAGAPFRAREMVDGQQLEQALLDDLWRTISQGHAGEPLVDLAHAADIGRKELRKYIPALLRPNVTILNPPTVDVRARIADIVGDVDAWCDTVLDVVQRPGLLRSGGPLQKSWRRLAEALQRPDGDSGAIVAECHDHLRAAADFKGVNKPGLNDPTVIAITQDSARIADCLSPLEREACTDIALRRFLTAAKRWCERTLQTRLDATQQTTFDQLLLTVHAALQAQDEARPLADALYAAWPVALVDECQDTDPLQYGILDAIYRDSVGAPRGQLVMIGDPKQAIYHFRGGDVQTYLHARSQVPETNRMTLGVNHRSSPGYVAAINQFYAIAGTSLSPPQATTQADGQDPTMHEDLIRYQDVLADTQKERPDLLDAVTGTHIARPLVLHELDHCAEGSDLETLALRACAGQIVHALSDQGYRLGDQPLRPGNIAVLLPSHRQIQRLAAMLKARGVPCVTTSQDSVFDSDAARELRLVLHAALHASDPRALRAALATRLCGGTLAMLQSLLHDPSAWDAQAREFHALQHLLSDLGPLAVVTRVLETHAPRLLHSADGERWLTDLRHLGELLQEAWVTCGGGERLLAWFADQMAGGDGGDAGGDAGETRALRLESDADRVRLLTLHMSKGLEFDIVYLPLMWKHARPNIARDGAQLLADPDGGPRQLVFSKEFKDRVAEQEYEERYRVLYVALTRAVHACHLFTLSPDASGKEIDKARSTAGVPLNAKPLPRDAAASSIEVRSGWDSAPGATLRVATPPASVRHARPLPAPDPAPLPMRHSYSTLAGKHRWQHDEEAAADDEDEALPTAEPEVPEPSVITVTPHPELEALAAVAGTDFGNAVHALFEHRAAGTTITAEDALAELKAHGVRAPEGVVLDTLAEPLARRLNAVLATPLGDASGPRLLDLRHEQMRAEMEFNYALDGATLHALRAACEAHGERGLVPAHERTLHGVMNGKIDLLFQHAGRVHVLDYKGNRLAQGERGSLEDYAGAALEREMARTGYRFQALLYTVATERYLRERLGTAYRRDHHLGDCWYLFIRAVGLQLPDGTPCGVWRHRFDDALLDAVQVALGAPRRQVA